MWTDHFIFLVLRACDSLSTSKGGKPTSEPPLYLSQCLFSKKKNLSQCHLSLVFSTTSLIHTPEHQLKYSSRPPTIAELSSESLWRITSCCIIKPNSGLESRYSRPPLFLIQLALPLFFSYLFF